VKALRLLGEIDENADVRALLETLDPSARDHLHRVLIRDQAERDSIASQLLRYRDGQGDDWVDIIDIADDGSGRAAEGGSVAR
jgi:hypothetical protein